MSWVLLRKQMRDIRERKLSLIALILIATIGVGGFVGMAGVYFDLYGARQRYYANYRLADFTINLKRGPQWMVERVGEIDNVVRVEGRVAWARHNLDLAQICSPIDGVVLIAESFEAPGTMWGEIY